MRPKREQPEQTGRMGYREPDEPPDGRLVIDRRPFWTVPGEQEMYEHAVSTNPRRPNEGPGIYIARIAAIAAGRIVPRFPDAAGTMPRARPMRADVQGRIADLEGQREPGSDDE